MERERILEIIDEIEVSQWEVQREGDPIKLNVWDFGGQEIQHSTHQFFLTTRSLYLLVVDARKGDQIGGAAMRGCAAVSIPLRDASGRHHLTLHRPNEPIHHQAVLLEERRFPERRR